LIPDANLKVNKLDMYDFYETFSLEHGLAVESEQSFSRKMTKDFGYKCKQLRDKGDRPYFYIGVKVIDWKQKVMDEQSTLPEVSEYSPETKEEMK
jgi:hypothetical protein